MYKDAFKMLSAKYFREINTQGVRMNIQTSDRDSNPVSRGVFHGKNRKFAHKKAIVAIAEISNNLTAMLHRLRRNDDGRLILCLCERFRYTIYWRPLLFLFDVSVYSVRSLYEIVLS